MAASLFAFVAAAILGRSWAEASRGFEPRSLDSESRVLTVTPRGQMTISKFLVTMGKLQVICRSKAYEIALGP